MKPIKDWPLRAKILIPVTLGLILLSIAFLGISYYTFRQYTIDDCIDYARGLNSLVSLEVDHDHIDDYIEQGRDYPGYTEIETKLYHLRDAYPDAKFLYLYQIREDGCHVVFDLDTPELEGGVPGEVVPFDPSFEPYRDDLLAGREVQPIISDDSFGYLLTVYTPIYDSAGLCKCYAAVDISMDDIGFYTMIVIRSLFSMTLAILLVFFILSIFFTDRRIVKPMKHMENKAYHDTLTGLLNRTALSDTYLTLNSEIAENTANFTIVMIDINYLKKVNDTYGHDKGNEYLINSANLVSECFGKENVYRAGGDEFVVVRRKKEQASLPAEIQAFREKMESLGKDDSISPWQKVSAAVGSAQYEEGRDESAQGVLKRADAMMYENKLAMKAARTD
ncbi:MAG: diguanylate cyclase [Solobacterium sp.]|nr:diguanylate cyclase [Solobacterium sp.]